MKILCLAAGITLRRFWHQFITHSSGRVWDILREEPTLWAQNMRIYVIWVSRVNQGVFLLLCRQVISYWSTETLRPPDLAQLFDRDYHLCTAGTNRERIQALFMTEWIIATIGISYKLQTGKNRRGFGFRLCILGIVCRFTKRGPKYASRLVI